MVRIWDTDNIYVWLLAGLVKKAWKPDRKMSETSEHCREEVGWDLS